jgi:hypothetical protein
MNAHLSNEQWTDAVLNDDNKSVASHLAACPDCRGELSTFASVVAGARAEVRKQTDLPEAFWQRQRDDIHRRWSARIAARPWKRWVWGTATVATVVLAATLLHRHEVPRTPAVAPADPDDALMFSVQQSIHRDLPPALQPAALLTREMNRAQSTPANP